MKILIVTQYFWPENFKINDVVTDLSNRGHKIIVLTGIPNYPDGNVYEVFKEEPNKFKSYSNASIIRIPMLPRGNGSFRLILNYLTFALSASCLGAFKLRKQEIDVIFVFEPSPITVGLPAAFIRRLKKVPMAFWVQDLWPESLQAVGFIRSPLLLGIIGSLVSFIYKRCDLILAQSKSFIPQIQKYLNKNHPVDYFPNWAENCFDNPDSTPASEVPKQSGSVNIMFAGNIGEAQDFPTILAAAEILKSHSHIRWLIVGDGRKALWVADEIKLRGLQNCVLLLGRHEPDRMPSFFKHADILLVSLKDEPIFSMTIPAKLQSYLAAGLPVVAMLNGEGAELVEKSGSGLTCAAGDSTGLAMAIIKFSQMTSEERTAIGRKGLGVSAREFDRNKLIDRLEVLLEHLITKTGPDLKRRIVQ